MLTCYSPVRRSSTPKGLSARLACVKHAASVRPEPGSNSPLNVYRQTAGTIRRPAVRGADTLEMPLRTGEPDLEAIVASVVWSCSVTGPAPDGVFACALAFSTLLSSQGADAHHQRPLKISSGATLRTYPNNQGLSTKFEEPTYFVTRRAPSIPSHRRAGSPERTTWESVLLGPHQRFA